ncbi:MAG: c-type cytochrome [Sandaracinaceae bacterium]|nr:c-type cytochrome [Sandaracinaceae bacterium]
MSEQHETDPVAGPILHVYDGIREADNRLPRWWLLTFYGSIVFAALYWFYYQGYKISPEPLAAYQEEAAAAAARTGRPLSNAELSAMVANPAMVNAGSRLFAQNCVVCHGDHAEGKIGPNLTDDFWVHGGQPTQVWATIKDGVPARGMPQWGTTLGAEPVQQVSAYVLSLRGSHVPGKAPEGERYAPSL